jgi:predicted metal-dependent phosphoesterase TrpH
MRYQLHACSRNAFNREFDRIHASRIRSVVMSKRVIDLHTHSTHSDGSDSPRDLVLHAKRAGAAAIALTDHDTVDGLDEALMTARECDIEFVNGIEISAEYSPGTMHILGYFINPENQSLAGQLFELREARANRNPQIATRLQELGIDLKYEEVVAVARSEVVGRPHFARVLLEKGCVKSIQEAFDKYLAKGASAFVDKRRLLPDETIRIIHAAGGAAVLAHPYQLKCRSEDELAKLLNRLALLGLDGVEAIYSRHSPSERSRYRDMAVDLGLIVTGGSDYHGTYKPDLDIVTGKGDLEVPYEVLESVKQRAEQRKCASGC